MYKNLIGVNKTEKKNVVFSIFFCYSYVFVRRLKFSFIVSDLTTIESCRFMFHYVLTFCILTIVKPYTDVVYAIHKPSN